VVQAVGLARIRNKHQKGLSADETADRHRCNAVHRDFMLSRDVEEIGFEYRFAEQEFFDSHPRQSMRMIGNLGWPAM
jgi:hypothetical protein